MISKKSNGLMDFQKHWIIKKYGDMITPVYYENAKVFWNEISEKGGYPLNEENNDEEFIFNWNKINPHYSFFFDYVGSEEEISNYLLKTTLINKSHILIDIQYSFPILKVETVDFVRNWYDFVNANTGLGSVLCSEDFSFLIEFTNDHSYLLYSNFPIKI